jgi:hypothetical protein
MSVLMLCTLLAVPSLAAGGKQGSGVAAVRPVTAITMPEGVVQLALPAGWQSNSALAVENGTPGFIHPSGAAVGQELPFWVVVDRCQRNMLERFPGMVKRVLEEGKPFGFALHDSTSYRTLDGRRVVQCAFVPSDDGAKRSLAFVEIPIGALLFRCQARDDQTWERYRIPVDEILRGVRFLPIQDDSKGTPGKK